MFRAKMFELVELVIPTTVTTAGVQIVFQAQNQLQTIFQNRDVWIKAIETYDATSITNSPLTSNNPVATVADIQNATLTLSVNNRLAIEKMPLAQLNRTYNFTAGTPFVNQLMLFRNMHLVDWTKSYVTVVAAPAAVLPRSYLFGVYYSYAPDPDYDPAIDDL